MAAIPPKTNVDGLITAATDLILGAFRKGVKQGRYEQQQEYLAVKESYERIRAERDALLADWQLNLRNANECGGCEAELLQQVMKALDEQPTLPDSDKEDLK